MEASAGNSDAAQEVEPDFLVEARLKECVEVGQNGTVNFAIARVVDSMISPGSFYVKAQAVLESDVVSADADVGAALFYRGMEARQVAIGGGRHEGAATDHDVRLLGKGEAGKQKKGVDGYEQREFSQYGSPCPLFSYSRMCTAVALPTKQPGKTAASKSIGRSELAAPEYQIATTGELKGLVWTDGVADGSADAEDIVGAEASRIDVGVALDVVVVNLGAYEDMVPNVIAETEAQVLHEVMGAGVVDASAEDTTRDNRRDVEASAVDADSGRDVGANLLSQFWLVESIEVGQDGPIGFEAAFIAGLTGPPCGLPGKTDAALEDDVCTDIKVGPTSFCLLEEGRGIGSGRQNCATAEINVSLLGRGKPGKEQAGENRCENR